MPDESPLANLFGGLTKTEAPAETQPNADASQPNGVDTQPAKSGETASEAPKAAGRPEHIPENFWRTGDNGEGIVDVENLGKSFQETKATLTRAQQELADLKKERPPLPSNPDEYWDSLDWNDIAKRAPNTAARIPDGAKDATVRSLMASAHHVGIPKEQAQKMLDNYMVDLNQHFPEPMTDDQLLQKAVSHQGPHGMGIAREVNTYLESKHGQTPFSDEQIKVLNAMTRDGPSLSTLYALIKQAPSQRFGHSGMDSAKPQVIDRQTEINELKKMLVDPKIVEERGDEIKRRRDRVVGNNSLLE